MKTYRRERLTATMRASLKGILALAMVGTLASCGLLLKPTPATVMNICPVDKIPKLDPVPLDPIKGAKRLKPGKQEITVAKPYGYFFGAREFGDLEWTNALKNHYAKALSEQIEKHNKTMEQWKESLQKDKGISKGPKR